MLRRWIAAALGVEAEITVRFVGEREGRALNRQFRGKDYATNVLSFGYGLDPIQGDLVICAPVVVREAAVQGKPLLAHYAHLVVHGSLHLAGFDHENDEEALAMEAKEKSVLAALGFPDPYASEIGDR